MKAYPGRVSFFCTSAIKELNQITDESCKDYTNQNLLWLVEKNLEEIISRAKLLKGSHYGKSFSGKWSWVLLI